MANSSNMFCGTMKGHGGLFYILVCFMCFIYCFILPPFASLAKILGLLTFPPASQDFSLFQNAEAILQMALRTTSAVTALTQMHLYNVNTIGMRIFIFAYTTATAAASHII